MSAKEWVFVIVQGDPAVIAGVADVLSKAMICDGNAEIKKVRGSSQYRLRFEASPDWKLPPESVNEYVESVKATGEISPFVEVEDHNADGE